ncbi:ABC transporter substrate-binding protein [Bacillus sp. BRMEA1]|uniref:ABC transporter substrate-binding protein n=1 Tax=Neobacillus endophyticus TaxID=2738405 RepID=UPI001563B34C|nr:ABC transporter substrate-binding protein [Neobacillus endophyticus]NRD79454.1 ABC transporter substrate-binding protein [Neobacillus endophyticus]
MKKGFIILASLMLLLLGACSNGGSNKTADSSGKLQKITIMLDWYPNAVHSFLYTAQEKGYFKKQGLDVTIQMPADTSDPLKLVAAGKIDMAFSYQPELLIARGENIPVRSFAAIVRHPLNQLMVPTDSAIHSPKDLAGKTVGYPSMDLDEDIIHTMVKTDGGDPSKVKMVDVGWDLIPAMATKKTNGLIGGYINHEKLLLDKEGHPMRTFNPADYGVPNYYELVLVGSDQELKTKPEVFKKFMTAIREGQKYVTAHPTEGLTILMNHEDKSSPLQKDVETKSLQILLPLMDAKDKPFGYQDPSTWDKVAQWLKNSKIIKQNIKASDAYINF